MEKILFVCHGNICRSAMAEFIMKDLVKKKGLFGKYRIDSAGVSSEESGNDLYPYAKEKLIEKKIPFTRHRARKIRPDDYESFDWIVCMDDGNLRALQRMKPDDCQARVVKLLPGQNVADPWYTGDFETAYQDIARGCRLLLAETEKETD